MVWHFGPRCYPDCSRRSRPIRLHPYTHRHNHARSRPYPARAAGILLPVNERFAIRVLRCVPSFAAPFWESDPNASGRPATTCGLGVFLEEGGWSLTCFTACETGSRVMSQRNVSHIKMERGHHTKQKSAIAPHNPISSFSSTPCQDMVVWTLGVL